MSFDKQKIDHATFHHPFWLHFGPGNIFRAFQANIVQTLLEDGKLDYGLIVVEGYDPEIIEKINRPNNNEHLLITLKNSGELEQKQIKSITESLVIEDDRTTAVFTAPSLQIASFTITEKGYIAYTNDDNSYMGKVTDLLYARFEAGQYPLAMVSMDNCSHNGDKLKGAILSFAKKRIDDGRYIPAFLQYINKSISFPWTMIDKITPRPDPDLAKKLGLPAPIITTKNTYVATYVNAEETEYLVIEDDFPNGRPDVLAEHIIFTDRETVDCVEKMKVCTCLNPIHTALAIFGCLLGYHKISDEMNDPDLKHLIEQIGYIEGLPVVTDPGVLNPKEFINTVIKVRLPNPFIPDTPQRIATDTSQKLAIRYGETIKAYLAKSPHSLSTLVGIPLVIAGWLRYLTAVDDQGNPFTLSPDPMADEISKLVKKNALQDILSNSDIFGLDLTLTQLYEPICLYFNEMCQGNGAVRNTLKKYIK